ncbi:8-amino-7-oxononanoate synthase [Haloechinothrix halophila]|uniref:8-amino-7-oxononanoate synthase n=1 Tax=Haloechinothrix halophila TaxID=1069073 RepID=UPI000420B82E|nr:8-amino-7-oxononanoate synthase [Haloechinothrix halophila]
MSVEGPAAPVPADNVLDWLDVEAEKRAQAGLVRRLRPRAAAATELDLAGNDYLGLARDKRVAGAAAAAALKWGAGSTGSRLVTGSTELHAELELELARFCGAQAALVFSSGFTANLGAVTTLSGRESAIVTDASIHASLIEGCRLSRADVAAVAHNDPSAVAHALRTRRHKRALVVTDSVFSVDGDKADLTALSTVCRETGAALLIDDAHGIGVLGDGGRGAVHEAGLNQAPDVVTTVTLSKALGAQGGAVLGPRRVIRHLTESARSFIFDTALAPSSAAAALTALRVLSEEPQRAERTREITARMAERFTAAGLPTSAPEAAVLAVRAPSPDDAVAWAARCAERGVRVGCFRPPSVPDGISRLRLTANAGLTDAEVEQAIQVVTETAPSAAS